MSKSIRSILAAIRDNEKRASDAHARGEHALAKHYAGIADSLAESIRY